LNPVVFCRDRFVVDEGFVDVASERVSIPAEIRWPRVLDVVVWQAHDLQRVANVGIVTDDFAD
jgi:hypothetical protein